MDLKDELSTRGRGHHVDIGLFANANAIACAVDRGAFEVGMEGKIVESAVGKAVSVILIGVSVLRRYWFSGGVYIWHSSFAL